MAQQANMSRQKRAALSLKQQRFIDEYVATNGNGTGAARAAGYAAKGKGRSAKAIDNLLATQAHENLRKPKVIAAIKQKLEVLAVDYGPDRVKRRLHEISVNSEAAGQFGPAVRSEELLGKAAGMWVDQSIALSGQLSDSHVAALLEIARRRQAEPVDLVDDVKVEQTDE
jgi:hypothetical protein